MTDIPNKRRILDRLTAQLAEVSEIVYSLKKLAEELIERDEQLPRDGMRHKIDD